MTTRAQLLETAKELQIVGRYDMSKAELEKEIHKAVLPEGSLVAEIVVEEKPKQGKERLFNVSTLDQEHTFDKKLAKQCGIVLQACATLKAQGVTYVSAETIGRAAVDCGLITKQDPKRIVEYYAKFLLEAGVEKV